MGKRSRDLLRKRELDSRAAQPERAAAAHLLSFFPDNPTHNRRLPNPAHSRTRRRGVLAARAAATRRREARRAPRRVRRAHCHRDRLLAQL